MSEANAEDGLLWSWTIKNVKMSEAQYRLSFEFLPFPPNQKKNLPCIPPAPSCTAETKFWQKGISRGFANPFPQNCFRKTESALYSCFRPFPLEKLCASHRGASAQRMHD